MHNYVNLGRPGRRIRLIYMYGATSLEGRFSVRATIWLFHKPNFRSLFAYVYSIRHRSHNKP